MRRVFLSIPLGSPRSPFSNDDVIIIHGREEINMCQVQKVQIRKNDDLIGFINRYMRGGLYERLHKGSLSSSSKKSGSFHNTQCIGTYNPWLTIFQEIQQVRTNQF